MNKPDQIMDACMSDRSSSIMDVQSLVSAELERGYHKFPRPQSSLHEGYAVMLEEVDEMWTDIKADRLAEALIEAIQVAAMAIRLIVDVGGPDAIEMLRTRDHIKRMGGG